MLINNLGSGGLLYGLNDKMTYGTTNQERKPRVDPTLTYSQQVDTKYNKL